MTRKWVLAALALPLLTAAGAEMTAAQFLAKAKKVEAQGMMALLSSEAGELRAEADRVGKIYRADIEKQPKSGPGRHSCPPPKGKGNLTGDELKAYLETLSPAQKARPYREAFYNLMKKKYPCK